MVNFLEVIISLCNTIIAEKNFEKQGSLIQPRSPRERVLCPLTFPRVIHEGNLIVKCKISSKTKFMVKRSSENKRIRGEHSLVSNNVKSIHLK